MPGESGVTVVTTLVCFTTLCARGCGCIGHPAFPAPSVFSGRKIPAQLGRIAPRDANACSTSLRGAQRRSNPDLLCYSGLLRGARNDGQCLGCLKIESALCRWLVPEPGGHRLNNCRRMSF